MPRPSTATTSPVTLIEEIELAPRSDPHDSRSVRTELERVRNVLRIPSVRLLYIGLTVAFLGFTGIAFWLPTFLQRTHDISEGAASAVTAGTALFAGIAGSLLGGILGDRWVAKGGPEKRVDLVVIGLLAGSVVLIGAIAIPTFALQVTGIAGAAFLFTLSFPNFAAAAADVLPGAVRGIGFALFTFLLTLGSALGPLVVGAVSDATGSLGVALAISVLPAIPGAFVVARVRHTIAADIARARTETRGRRTRLRVGLGAHDPDVADALARRPAEVVRERQLLALRDRRDASLLGCFAPQLEPRTRTASAAPTHRSGGRTPSARRRG